MPYLEDGTIIPHYLSLSPVGQLGSNGLKHNVALRSGEVKEIVYPGDKRSVSKLWVEYRVEVQEKSGHHTGSVVSYPNCWVVNAFGGAADRSTYTLRADPGNKTNNTGLGQGSKVVLLCINGDQPNAIILGGLRDTNDSPDQQTDGHNLSWSFNGLGVDINDTGELSLVFNGATNIDGSPRSDVTAGAPGSTLKFSDDGSITVEQGDQTIFIDTPNQNITLSSNGYNIKVDSSGAKLGDPNANDAFYKGTSHRQLDKTMNQTILQGLATLTTLLTTISLAIATASASLIAAGAAMTAPIVGAMAAGPVIAVAGTALAAASIAVSSMVTAVQLLIQAINIYEAGAQSTLSKENFTS